MAPMVSVTRPTMAVGGTQHVGCGGARHVVFGRLPTEQHHEVNAIMRLVDHRLTVPSASVRIRASDAAAGIGGLLLAWIVRKPLDIIRPIVPISTLTCGLWCFAIVWADRRMLPSGLRMSRVWIALNLLAGAAMTAFGTRALRDALGLG